MGFKDYFSEDSGSYGRYRPEYPPELFSWLSSLAPAHDRAWDCATGTGQAARGLRRYFAEVIATDASESQIQNADGQEGIVYRVAPAEQSGIETGTVDLVTVAQALHWFNIPEFFRETERVLKPGGILAVWSYDLFRINAEIDRIVDYLYFSVLGRYWPPERKMVKERYSGIEFPLSPVPSPHFEMQAKLSLDQVLGYLGTWSAVKRYIEDRGSDPLLELHGRLLNLWDGPYRKRLVKWPLTVIARRKEMYSVGGGRREG